MLKAALLFSLTYQAYSATYLLLKRPLAYSARTGFYAECGVQS